MPEQDNCKKWKVLIVCSSPEDIHPEYYEKDYTFDPQKYVLFNVGKNKFSNDKIQVVNSCEVPGYIRLGRKYAESEVIYNVAKLGLFQDYDYIGLMHYDFVFEEQKTNFTNITELISSFVDSNIDLMSFFTGMVGHVIGPYNVLLDERRPNCLFVRNSGLQNPKSINERIVSDIKRVLGKDLDLSKIDPHSNIALCCSFLAKKEIFAEIGKLIIDAIEDGYFDKFDTQDKHRFPGQAIERYVALYSLLCKKACFTLEHRFVGGQIDLQNDRNAENY